MDANRSLSDSRIHEVHSLNWEGPPKVYMLSGERLTKIQATTRPEHVCREVWSEIGKAAQKREKQE